MHDTARDLVIRTHYRVEASLLRRKRQRLALQVREYPLGDGFAAMHCERIAISAYPAVDAGCLLRERCEHRSAGSCVQNVLGGKKASAMIVDAHKIATHTGRWLFRPAVQQHHRN